MGNLYRSFDEGNHRIDHDKFQDVAVVHYKEGEIKDFGLESTNPITPDGTVTVEMDGNTTAGVPIFYHCRKGWFDENVGNLKANKSLEFAPWGFRVGHKVMVMLRESKAVGVLGHNEPPTYYTGEKNAPWPCNDIIRVQWHRTIGTEGNLNKPLPDGWGNWFKYQALWHCLHFRASTQELWKSLDAAPEAPDGAFVTLPHRAKHIFGMKELRWGTIVWYAGDWLILVGPIAYVITVFSIGMPGPVTQSLLIQAAVWTPERETEWIAVGAQKEVAAGSGGGIWPHLYTEIPYPHMQTQSTFTKSMSDIFVGFSSDPNYRAKWIVSEFWVYDWDRAASDQNTPNTPAG